jgi:hypothetical protein
MLRNPETLLIRSRHVQYFQQHGTIYAYHNLFGYILAMSPDLVDLLEFHRVLRTADEVSERFDGTWEAEQLDEFVSVFQMFACLVDSELAEERSAFAMVAMRPRWVVYHAPDRTHVTVWTTGRDGTSRSEVLSPWASALFLRMDGETTVERLISELLADDEVSASLVSLPNAREAVRLQLAHWTHADSQVCKLAKAPLSKFGKEHQWPSYLRSTMPYAPYRPGVDAVPTDPLEPTLVPLNPPHAYYEHEVADAEAQFEGVETTLSHLFRVPHPILDGNTYGERVLDAMILRGSVGPTTRRIWEVGGGLGFVALGTLLRLRRRLPDVYDAVQYTIVDLSPALREAQQALLAKAGVIDKVRWIAANAEEYDFAPESIDLLICNEVIGDFTTIKVTAAEAGLTGEEESPDARTARVGKLGAAAPILEKLTLRDAPDP